MLLAFNQFKNLRREGCLLYKKGLIAYAVLDIDMEQAKCTKSTMLYDLCIVPLGHSNVMVRCAQVSVSRLHKVDITFRYL